jgi:hypothetical protein
MLSLPTTTRSINRRNSLSRLGSNIVYNRAQRVICALNVGNDSLQGIQ